MKRFETYQTQIRPNLMTLRGAVSEYSVFLELVFAGIPTERKRVVYN